jgi:hypothetical protein
MKNRDFILLSIFFLATVFLWMVFEIMHTANKSTVAPVVAEQIKPITPKFDSKVLKQLKERQN